MAFRDVLLQLNGYPFPPSDTVIEQAVQLAEELGAHISALTFTIELPGSSNPLANALLDLPGIIAIERQKGLMNAQKLISAFQATATRRGVPHQQLVESCAASQVATITTEHARLRDLTILPFGEEATLDQYVAENVIFGSGRPTIVLPEAPRLQRPISLEVVGVAWDFSRPAARAMADALPILKRAKTVRVVTVTQEKSIATKRSGADLATHLAFHGINVVLDEEASAGRTVGQVLCDYASAKGLDLLVMGAFGHSRLRDFVLGGATKTIIAHPPLPVLLSH